MLRALLVAVAVIAVVARYLRERRRLDVVGRLTGTEGLDFLERTRARGDRFDLVLAIVLAAGAAAALVALSAARP